MAYIGKSPSQGVRNRFQYQATAGQDSFSGSDANGLTLTYTDSLYMDVYQNGILLVPGDDYTATTGTTVVLVQGASVDDIVEMVVYDVFSVPDAVSQSAGGTFSGNVTFAGTITGTSATLSTADNNAQLTLKSTDADANVGPVLDLQRDSSSPADNDVLGIVNFKGENDASEVIDYGSINAYINDASDGTEDGRVIHRLYKGGTNINYVDMKPDEIVFNEDSADVDFRVESDGDANAIFMEASSGVTMFQTTDDDPVFNNAVGASIGSNNGSAVKGIGQFSCSAAVALRANRTNEDGVIIGIHQAGNQEGSISISGSTTSYNAFSGSHWSRLSDNSKPTILKGTVIETIDEMCDWYQAEFTVDGSTIKSSISLPSGKKVGDTITHTYHGTDYDAKIIKENDNKHTKCKISDTADSKRVYGVFAAWDNDDDTVNDMYVTAIGTHVVRINKDVTVSAGDLLSSNGDGTAKVQDDDTIRSKTIGKVLTNIKQETYDDGSYTVPCALYCG